MDGRVTIKGEHNGDFMVIGEFHVLIVAIVTWIYTCFKIHRTEYLNRQKSILLSKYLENTNLKIISHPKVYLCCNKKTSYYWALHKLHLFFFGNKHCFVLLLIILPLDWYAYFSVLLCSGLLFSFPDRGPRLPFQVNPISDIMHSMLLL